jgi:hypothetical protein
VQNVEVISFDNFASDELFDVILFTKSFHHLPSLHDVCYERGRGEERWGMKGEGEGRGGEDFVSGQGSFLHIF